MFHYVRSDGIIYLCMTDMDAKRRVAFAFLADIRQKFVEKYGDAIYTANAFAMNQSFAPIIKRQMVRRRRALPPRRTVAGSPHRRPHRCRRAQEYFNDPSSDSLSRVRNQLDDVKSVMVENIGVWGLPPPRRAAGPPRHPTAVPTDKILERSEKIELLVDKTHQLAESSTRFEKQSRSLRRNMWWKNFKMRMLIIFIVLVRFHGGAGAVAARRLTDPLPTPSPSAQAIIGVIVLVVEMNKKK